MEETLEECERLLAAAEADAAEVRQTAQRHAQERAEATTRALTTATERLLEEAAADRAAALEARTRAYERVAEAEQLWDQMDAEVRSAAAARHQAEEALAHAHQEVQRLTALAEARLRDAIALQAEVQQKLDAQTADYAAATGRQAYDRLQQFEGEMAARVGEPERRVAPRFTAAEEAENRARRAEGERSPAPPDGDAGRTESDSAIAAERGASQQSQGASSSARALLHEAERTAAELIARAEDEAAKRRADLDAEVAAREAVIDLAAAERLNKADDRATRQLLDAVEEARAIITSAEAEASQIRARARAQTRPPDDAPVGSAANDDAPDAAAGAGPRRRARWQRNGGVVALVVAMMAASGLVSHYVASPYTVSAESMEPGLSDGDRLLVNKLAYQSESPDHGDVVAFHHTERGGADRMLVKRVVGVPGDVVHAEGDRVFVNGVPIDEPWVQGRTAAFGPVEVPHGSLFVLGDNREVSVDSRLFGVIDEEAVVGRVEFVYWPPGEVGGI